MSKALIVWKRRMRIRVALWVVNRMLQPGEWAGIPHTETDAVYVPNGPYPID